MKILVGLGPELSWVLGPPVSEQVLNIPGLGELLSVPGRTGFQHPWFRTFLQYPASGKVLISTIEDRFSLLLCRNISSIKK